MDVIKKEFVKVWEDKDCLATEPQFVPRSKTCGFFSALRLSDCESCVKLKQKLLEHNFYLEAQRYCGNLANYTVAVYNWSIANNFVMGFYCRCLEILCQIAFNSVANYFRSYRKTIWYKIYRHLQ